jgi:hypothetical protein
MVDVSAKILTGHIQLTLQRGMTSTVRHGEKITCRGMTSTVRDAAH